MWLAYIFFYFVAWLLILLLIYFAVQKLFRLMYFHMFIFAFVAFVLVSITKIVIAKIDVKELTPCVLFLGVV